MATTPNNQTRTGQSFPGSSVDLQRRRSILLRGLIAIARSAQGHKPPEGQELDTEEKAWEYATGAIPMHHLEECFKRALRAKCDNYPLSAVEVNTQWADYQRELARATATNELNLLLEAHKSQGRKLLTLSEWQQKHSDANPAHDKNRCAFCRERAERGLPPVTSISGFEGYVGRMDKYEAEAEAKATLDRFREERKAEGFRPLREEPEPLFEDEDLSDLPF